MSFRSARLAIPLAFVILVGARPLLAWGREGHTIVASIAETLLSFGARARVTEILRPGESLASVASWADGIRSSRRETAPWHYVDIPISRPSLDMARDCRGGNCVIAKLEEFSQALRSKNLSPGDRREALMFVVHFVGDMHQPLHSADNGDHGGNNVRVVFLGRQTNLHSLWDSGLLNRMEPEDRLLVDLLHGITPDKVAEWSQGSPEAWANESHQLAKDVAYGRIPGGIPGRSRVAVLGQPYATVAHPVVKVQLQRAGVRLAAVLNNVLQ